MAECWLTMTRCQGRSTLTHAMDLVESRAEWRARVVYGDTDSLFVELPGRSKEEAFRIGQEIADAVTAANPPPVRLKLEKVGVPPRMREALACSDHDVAGAGVLTLHPTVEETLLRVHVREPVTGARKFARRHGVAPHGGTTLQVTPMLDCKGIETVRRDQCAATAKLMDQALKILFTTKDLSKVKQYLQRQWKKIMMGGLTAKDFVFAKEVRCCCACFW